jgi:hypothetical protein
MRFIGRWLSDTLLLGLSLLFAGLAMQAPALTHAYSVSLLQVAQQMRQDIDQRETTARQFYHLNADTDAALVQQLQPLEPANAATLAQSLDRVNVLQTAHDRILAALPLQQPVTAILDAYEDPHGYKREVIRTTLATYAPEIVLTTAGAIYALIGLIIGSFLAQLVSSIFRGFGAREAGGRYRSA